MRWCYLTSLTHINRTPHRTLTHPHCNLAAISGYTLPYPTTHLTQPTTHSTSHTLYTSKYSPYNTHNTLFTPTLTVILLASLALHPTRLLQHTLNTLPHRNFAGVPGADALAFAVPL